MATNIEHCRFDFNTQYDCVHFVNVETTDFYRKDTPYKIFRFPGESHVIIEFKLLKSKADGIDKVTINLNHCSTSARGIIDIFFNNTKVVEKHLSPICNFGREDFHFIKGFVEGKNTIKIFLHDPSPGVYWLSDAIISLSLKIPKTLKDQAGKFIVGNDIAYNYSEIPKTLNSYLKDINKN